MIIRHTNEAESLHAVQVIKLINNYYSHWMIFFIIY